MNWFTQWANESIDYMKYCECEGKYVDDYKCGTSTQLCHAEQRAIARKGIYQHSEPSKEETKLQSEQETDPLDKFMDEEIAYLKGCNPVDQWGRLENKFAAGMIHAYERIKAEREYIAHLSDCKKESTPLIEQEGQEELWKDLLDYVEDQRPYVEEMMKMYIITRK